MEYDPATGLVDGSVPPNLSFSDILRTTDWRHGELENLARYAKEFILLAHDYVEFVFSMLVHQFRFQISNALTIF